MMKQIIFFLWILFLAFPVFSQEGRKSKPIVKKNDVPKPNQSPSVSAIVSSTEEKARPLLNAVLEKYRKSNIQLKVVKTFRVPVIDKVSREEGALYLQKAGKFRYFMRSSSSSGQLMVFDGEHLWYQPDIKEKTVFQLSSHPQWRLFSGLFDPQQFFQVFQVEKLEKMAGSHIIHLKPRQSVTEVKQIILKVHHYIQEVRVLWNDMNNWQEYEFSNPWVKKQFPKSLFVFDTEGFEVISKNQEK